MMGAMEGSELIESLEADVARLKAKLKMAGAEVERLREALKKYGQHRPWCPQLGAMPCSRCTCVYAQSLADLDEKEEV